MIGRKVLAYRPGIRLLLFLLILNCLQPPPILVIVGQTRPVLTTHPILGVHTRLTDEVEEWKIQRSLQMVNEMGAGWIVEFFPWAYYQAEDGYINWDHADMVVTHARSQDLKIIARLGLTPDWARPEETSLNYLDPTAFADFAAFAATFAAHYQGQVAAIVVWNEPNLSFEWGYRPGTAQDYTALLQTVYPAVKAANPEMIVLGGALAPTLEPAGSPWGLSDLQYLGQLYQAGAAGYFDGLAVHTYGLTFPAEADPAPDLLNFRRVELLRQIMLDFGDGDTPIYITEMGWNDHPRWTLAVRPGQRIQYTLEAITYAETHWPYVEMMAIWAFRYPIATQSYPDYFTLVTPDFIPRPLYEALQTFTGN